ncbi:hypothetical protein MXMO3_00924 [Maritalea myrionectae]|uniref:Uncharacterized protein n=1 Tax=Maritalea myrionectae TaxID=454601 RepID=A0A2R4MBZ3_9HYPH|nr:hypothetical protein MXMO3_00924 [Maritalea myrionectae]
MSLIGVLFPNAINCLMQGYEQRRGNVRHLPDPIIIRVSGVQVPLPLPFLSKISGLCVFWLAVDLPFS